MKKAAIFSQKRFSFLDRTIYLWRRSMVLPYLKKNARICDLGSGENGYFLQELRNDMGSGIGFDLTVDEDFRDDKIALVKADLEGPVPLPDNNVDTVLSLAVIEHLVHSRDHVREAYRILTPGGSLILTTPTKLAEPILETLAFLHLINKDSIKDHKHYFTISELIALCKEAGFSNVTWKHFQGGCNQIIVATK